LLDWGLQPHRFAVGGICRHPVYQSLLEAIMQLTDLLPIEAWQTLEVEIRQRSGLSASIFNTDGIRITDNLKWPNRLCPEIKANPKGQSFICATAHMNLANQARRSNAPVVEECDAGLVKLVVPICVDGTFLGAVGACGLLLDDGEVDTFLVNKITEMDEARLEPLTDGIPTISSSAAAALNQFIVQRIAAIVADYQARQA
jgi:ligand-binding sensor protein